MHSADAVVQTRASDENSVCLSVHPSSIHWIIRHGGNAGVLLQAATEAKNSPQVYIITCTLADLVCLAGKIH